MERSTYRIGLTGNIATGKSTVAEMLVELGAAHIDADRVAHAVVAPDGPAYPAVVAAFGPEILKPNGEIDRRALGTRVFANPQALARLEALVHPPTIVEVNRRIAKSDAPVVVVEAIKLLESGMAEHYDAIWVTTCPRDEQIRRLMTYRGLDRAAAMARVDAQPPQAEKLSRADVIIDTHGPLEKTRTQVEAAWAAIR